MKCNEELAREFDAKHPLTPRVYDRMKELPPWEEFELSKGDKVTIEGINGDFVYDKVFKSIG